MDRVRVPELNTYLLLNQLAYSILAFPIGTVLSIGPLLLIEQNDFTLTIVGWLMAGGEGIGIIGMKFAEISDKGFILSRPHDLHLVNLAIALSLITMPIGPSPLSAIGMMTTQFFNSSAKPVLGENLYRLALLADQDPAKVFAKANMYRRIGNSMICVVSPLLYSQFASLSFYVIGSIILLFLFILLHRSNGIKCMLQELMAKDPICTMHSYDSDQDSKFSTIGALKSIVKIKSDRNLAEMMDDDENADNALDKFPIASNVKVEIADIEQEDLEIPDFDCNKIPYESVANKEEQIDKDDIEEFLPQEKGNQPFTAIEKDFNLRGNEKFMLPQSTMLFDMHQASVESKETLYSSNDKQSSCRLLYFLLVQTFPFLDAAITRLPFVFLTVAIADDFSVELEACILFAYQSGRAVSQGIQLKYCGPIAGYWLDGICLIGYIALIMYIQLFRNAKYWFIPFAIFGICETLPLQQFYLMKMFGANVDEDNINLRRAVKATHTSTAIGSMAAFIAASQVFQRFGIPGVSYLGLSIQATKLLTFFLIDFMMKQ